MVPAYAAEAVDKVRLLKHTEEAAEEASEEASDKVRILKHTEEVARRLLLLKRPLLRQRPRLYKAEAL